MQRLILLVQTHRQDVIIGDWELWELIYIARRRHNYRALAKQLVDELLKRRSAA